MLININKGYIGARRPDNEFRWRDLLDAALEQPHPSVELQKAIAGLKMKPRGNFRATPTGSK